MATNLDLEEQEQLDALKHFWNQWGNLITWMLIVVLGTYVAWNGWQYWQRKQAASAAVLYDEVHRNAENGDVQRLQRALSDMEDRYGAAVYAAQSALLAAKVFHDKDKPAEAKAALVWASEKASDDGLKAVARLRLASIQTEEKAYDEALKTLSASFPDALAPLAADRRGDVLLLQGKRAEAMVEFGKAYQGLGSEAGYYRRIIGYKLNSLGIDPNTSSVAGAAP